TEAKAEKEKPTIIIGNTVMGRGALAADCTSFECQVSTHGQPLSAAGADFGQTIKNLGGNPDDPFVIFEETKQLYEKRQAELK
ncbi:MAG TPA: transketolase, partial [Porphyromonadaceae bacterium]|nr:transketolase [Porphyromonadaceae bacterium]